MKNLKAGQPITKYYTIHFYDLSWNFDSYDEAFAFGNQLAELTPNRPNGTLRMTAGWRNA